MGLEGAWLVRLACTLRRATDQIAEAIQTLYLRPKNPAAGENAALSAATCSG